MRNVELPFEETGESFVVAIDDLVKRDRLNPRVATVYWGTAAKYEEAMRGGAEFPPVEVAEDDDGRWVLVDGFHRVESADAAGYEHVVAVPLDLPKDEWFQYATQKNARHGKPLGPKDLASATWRLKEEGVPLPELCQLVDKSKDDLVDLWDRKIVETADGEHEAISRPLEDRKDVAETRTQQELANDMKGVKGDRVPELLDQLHKLLDNGYWTPATTQHVEQARDTARLLLDHAQPGILANENGDEEA